MLGAHPLPCFWWRTCIPPSPQVLSCSRDPAGTLIHCRKASTWGYQRCQIEQEGAFCGVSGCFPLRPGTAAGSPAEPPSASGDQLSTMSGGVPTPGLLATLGRQKPGGLHSFHPCAAGLPLQLGRWEGSGLWVTQSCSVAAPGIQLTSPSALVVLVSSAAHFPWARSISS